MLSGVTDTSPKPPPGVDLPYDSRPDPLELLQAAHAAEPGWSEPFGGPEGVAVLAELARQAVMRQAGDLAALRRVAIAEWCRTSTPPEIGRALGISRNAVHKLNNEVARQPHDLNRLLWEGLW